MKITIIARMDLTGLGNQSRNWVRLLNPNKIILIDSTPFNGNEQHPEWYEGYDTWRVNGFIQDHMIDRLLDDTDILLTFETPYSYKLIARARSRGIKTVIQNNWEFTDYLQSPLLPMPDLLVNHSYWHLDDQEARWPDITEYCPTPLFADGFNDVYLTNLKREGKVRFLHVAGRNTYEDRNGTNDVLKAISLIPKNIDFELVIKTQTTEVDEIDDPRVVIDRSSPDDERELYRDFDAMILPRRYGGACLPAAEALMSGLPVIMTDIDPNKIILPGFWLVGATKKTEFMARTMIDVYESDLSDLAGRISQLAIASPALLYGYKILARETAMREYSDESVLEKWSLFTKKLGVQ